MAGWGGWAGGGGRGWVAGGGWGGHFKYSNRFPKGSKKRKLSHDEEHAHGQKKNETLIFMLSEK